MVPAVVRLAEGGMRASVHQADVDWLMDPDLMAARTRWQQAVEKIDGIQEHLREIQGMWTRLRMLSQHRTLSAEMTGLLRERRLAAATSDELRATLLRAEGELEIHWRAFVKTSAEVVSRRQARRLVEYSAIHLGAFAPPPEAAAAEAAPPRAPAPVASPADASHGMPAAAQQPVPAPPGLESSPGGGPPETELY